MAENTAFRANWNPDVASDLRRKHRAELVEALVTRARLLSDADRALLEAVFRDGKTAVALAPLLQVSARLVRARIHRLVKRLNSPQFAVVSRHLDRWLGSRRRVAHACFIEGRSIRDTAARLHLSTHAVRKHREAIEALVQVAAHLPGMLSRSAEAG